LAKTGEAAANIVTSIMAATSTDILFLNTSSILLPQGRDSPAPPLVQRYHGSKHVVLGASPIWTIFGELLRTVCLRTSENPSSAYYAKSPILTPFATGVEFGVSTPLLQAPAALQLLD
jgi:hypothetical protein